MELKFGDPHAHFVSATAIINKDGKYLITKRSPNEKAFPNMWTVPGGKISVEDYANLPKPTPSAWYGAIEEALKREVKEEAGLNGTVEKELGKIKYWFYSEEDKVRVRKTVTFFLIKYESGDTSDHDTDAEEVRWLPIGQALKIMTYPSERQMVEKAKELL